MTDYEKFIKSDGRDELIKQVRKKIDQLGIDYLYLQFVSVTGRIMGKGIPADHWENIANGGFQLVYGATVVARRPYFVTGSSMAATCSLIAGRSPRRRASALVSVSPSAVQRPSAKISSGWKRDL